MNLRERRSAALTELGAADSRGALIAALASIQATVAGGLSLPPDQIAAIDPYAEHADSGVRFAWARVLLVRGLRMSAVGRQLDRLWAWSEDAPPEIQERRRDAWVALARALPDRTSVSPLMADLVEEWRLGNRDRLELIEHLSQAVALPPDVAPLLRAGVALASPEDAPRLLRMWCRLALAGVGEDAAVASQASRWRLANVVPANSLPGHRLVQVVAQRGDLAAIQALREPADTHLDMELVTCLGERMLRGGAQPGVVGLLAELAVEHGGGLAWAALNALRKGALAGADLGAAIPVLAEQWAELSYESGPWEHLVALDIANGIDRTPAPVDALLILAAAAEPSDTPLPELGAQVRATLSEHQLLSLGEELSVLDRWYGPGAADRARARLGLTESS